MANANNNAVVRPNILRRPRFGNLFQGLGLLANDADLNPQAAAVAAPQPPDAAAIAAAAAANAAVNNLADLIANVAIAPPPPIPAPVQVQRPADQRPVVVAEEELPINLTRIEAQRDIQTLDILGRLARHITADNNLRADLPAPQRVTLDALLMGMEQIQAGVQQKQQMLVNAEQKARRLRHQLDYPAMPNDLDHAGRNPVALSGKNIRDNAPAFNPKTPGHDLRVTWSKLRDYGEICFFNAADFVFAIGQVLEENAYIDFKHLRENGANLAEILEHLEESYVPKQSFYEDQMAVDNFYRFKAESLQKAMRRALMCVEKLRLSVSDQDWPVLLNKYMEDILMKIVSVSTRNYLRKMIELYTEQGIQYDLQTLIHKADMHEITHDAAPRTEQPFQGVAGLHGEKPLHGFTAGYVVPVQSKVVSERENLSFSQRDHPRERMRDHSRERGENSFFRRDSSNYRPPDYKKNYERNDYRSKSRERSEKRELPLPMRDHPRERMRDHSRERGRQEYRAATPFNRSGSGNGFRNRSFGYGSRSRSRSRNNWRNGQRRDRSFSRDRSQSREQNGPRYWNQSGRSPSRDKRNQWSNRDNKENYDPNYRKYPDNFRDKSPGNYERRQNPPRYDKAVDNKSPMKYAKINGMTYYMCACKATHLEGDKCPKEQENEKRP